MEFWIRNKEKNRLVKVRDVYFFGNSIESNGGLLGDYATAERCIEIIDEIQKILMGVNPIIPPSVLVYEMPKE
jgi:hypothetical protein